MGLTIFLGMSTIYLMRLSRGSKKTINRYTSFALTLVTAACILFLQKSAAQAARYYPYWVHSDPAQNDYCVNDTPQGCKGTSCSHHSRECSQMGGSIVEWCDSLCAGNRGFNGPQCCGVPVTKCQSSGGFCASAYACALSGDNIAGGYGCLSGNYCCLPKPTPKPVRNCTRQSCAF